MEKIKFILSNVKFRDLKKQSITITDLHESLGNMIYTNAADIGWRRIAEEIYDGKEVELTRKQLEELSVIIDQSMFIIFIKVGFREYIESLITEMDK